MTKKGNIDCIEQETNTKVKQTTESFFFLVGVEKYSTFWHFGNLATDIAKKCIEFVSHEHHTVNGSIRLSFLSI